MGRRGDAGHMEPIPEMERPLTDLEQDFQMLKAKVSHRFTLVHEGLVKIPALERKVEELTVQVPFLSKGMESLMVKMDQLLGQQGEGSSCRTTVLERGKGAAEGTPTDPRVWYLRGAGREENPNRNEEQRTNGEMRREWVRPEGGNGGEVRVRKLDVPVFEGENPDGWLFRAERYFDLNQALEAERLEAAVVSLEGRALTWFQGEDGRRAIRRWAEFKDLLRDRFRSSQPGTRYEMLHALRQEGAVEEYRQRFELLVVPLTGVPDKVLEGNFVGGLKAEIQAELRMLQPTGMGRVMAMTQRIEERNNKIKGVKPTPPSKPNPCPHSSSAIASRYTANTGVSARVAGGETKVETPQYSPFKRLSEAEIMERRAKGLCYRCDEKYGLGHRCKQRELQILLVFDEGREDDASEKGEMKADDAKGAEIACMQEPSSVKEADDAIRGVGLALTFVVGLTHPKTMKLRGKIRGVSVVVLVDSGASHNFLSVAVVENLGIQVRETKACGITMGKGTVTGAGVCEGVTLELPGVRVTGNFLPLELANADVILGIQWLETLGEVVVNWKLLRMSFKDQGRLVVLQGDPAMIRTQVSLKAISWAVQVGGQGVLVERVQEEEIQCAVLETNAIEIQNLLEQFVDVFRMPQGFLQ